MVDNQNENSFLDKNTILAVVLSFAVFVLWQAYMSKNQPATETTTQVEKSVDSAAKEVAKDEKFPSEQVPAHRESQIQENLVHFQGDNVSFDVSNRGMGLKNITLNKLTDRAGNPIRFSWTAADINDERAALASTDPKNAVGPIENKKVLNLLDEGNFVTFYNGDPIYFDVQKSGDNTFIGKASLTDGQLTKKITFDDKTFSAKIEIQSEWQGQKKNSIQTTFFDRIKTADGSMLRPSNEGTDVFNVADGSEERERQKLDTAFASQYKNVTLAAIGSQYFSLIIKDFSDIMPSALSELIVDKDVGFAKTTLIHKPSSNDSMKIDYLAFMGPKDYDLLNNLEPDLARAINFGFFGFIAKPMLHLLQYLHAVIGNWGVAIILLTLIVRLLLFPVALSSMRSMKKMQKIQPELKVIREKFKDDAQKMNIETMALMKREGANPVGGCLPMFAQIPVFFALYSVLGQSVELYKAPFILWIHDLSYQDPFYVMPVMVSGLFFLQMKLSPSTMDPNQQKVMMIMPLVFGALMFSMPAGLMVYFLTNTIFGIGQQFYINREKAAT